jgi:complement component 1 Q subcomponent-binding protein, mitochondrial
LLRSTHENLYTGPPFEQLDEELQSLMEQYLEKRGMDTSLAMFIPDYIDVKEQKEYLKWLGRMKEFVEDEE